MSAVGVSDFGRLDTLENCLTGLVQVSSDPRADVVADVLRDVANLAMGNSDNHGRSTALSKRPDGTKRLSPLFDVAPMKRSRQIIMRSSRWACMRAAGADHSPDGNVVAAALAPLGIDPNDLVQAIRRFAKGADLGLPELVRTRSLANCREIVDRAINPPATGLRV